MVAQGVGLVVVGHEDPRMGWCTKRLRLAQQAADDACALVSTAAAAGTAISSPVLAQCLRWPG